MSFSKTVSGNLSSEQASSSERPTYVRALPLRDLVDIDRIKAEIEKGNVLIVKITPIAKRSIDETKSAINLLVDFVKGVGGDIARLGEERIVITPPSIKIWREEESVSVAVSAAQPHELLDE